MRARQTEPTDQLPRTGRTRDRGDLGQQAILLVVGISTIMFLFSLVLVSAVNQQTPAVNRTLIDHDAYRALQAGVSEFVYGVSQDPNAAACSGIPQGTSPQTYKPSASCNYFTSKNLSLAAWQLVPNQPTDGGSTNYNPTEWVSIGYPVLNQAGNYIQVTVVGAAGFANSSSSIQYQTANITLNATNDFLLNVTWSNYNVIDTNSLDANLATIAPQGCTYLWQQPKGDPNCTGFSGALGSGSYTPQFPVYGPVYSNDNILLANGCTPFQQVVTAAPQLTTPNTTCARGSGTTGANYPAGAQNVTNHAVEVPPTTLAAGSDLADAAKSDGCYYTGPTTITLTGSSGFTVSSPGTATNASGDSVYSLASDTSTCPVTGSAHLPANGVIYVDTMPGSCSAPASKNPLTAVYDGSQFQDGQLNQYSGETQSPGCEGDVILNGSLSGALAIGVANNIVIDGNVTYADCPISTTVLNSMNSANPQGPWPTGSSTGACNISATGTNDVLGLIANDYVEMNLPLYTDNRRQGNSGTPYAACLATAPALNCTVHNPVIMGSILALAHAFAVPNFNEVTIPVGEIDYYGSMAENFIDVEESGNNGYGVDYNWDPRLAVLSPPHYLSPGTPAWVTQSFSVTVGKCSSVWPVDTTTCPTTASPGSTVP